MVVRIADLKDDGILLHISKLGREDVNMTAITSGYATMQTLGISTKAYRALTVIYNVDQTHDAMPGDIVYITDVDSFEIVDAKDR